MPKCPSCGATLQDKVFEGQGVAVVVAPLSEMSEGLSALVDGVVEQWSP